LREEALNSSLVFQKRRYMKMKRITLLLSLIIIQGILNQAEAAPFDLRNIITSNSDYNIMWTQQSIYTNYILALFGTNWEVPLWELEMGNFTAMEPRNTILTNLGITDGVLFALGRRNHDTPAPVPEPSVLLLMGTGLIGLAGFIKTNKRSPNRT
jgi:hypothetical protein